MSTPDPALPAALRFFSFDGVDGVGKTTQLRLFCDWLREQGREVTVCRDPGSTRLGEAIREILLQHTATPIQRRSEMLLYMAARAQLVEEVIQPALAAGKTVVCDRFLLANVVYQGHAGGLPVADVWEVGRVATDGLTPDLTILLDMPAKAAAARIHREHDRVEARGEAFLEKVRQGFLREAERHPDRIAVINAARDIDPVQCDIRDAVARMSAAH